MPGSLRAWLNPAEKKQTQLALTNMTAWFIPVCPPVLHFLSVCIFSPYYIQPAIFNGYSSPDSLLFFRCSTIMHTALSLVYIQSFYTLNMFTVFPVSLSCRRRRVHTDLRTVSKQIYVQSAHRPTYSQHTDLRTVSKQIYVHSQHTDLRTVST